MILIDIKDDLPRASWEIGREPAKTSITLHYNGGPIPQHRSRSEWVAHLRDIAIYHRDTTNAWKTWQADGISYHYAVLPDGTVCHLRDDDAILWHCGHEVGNAHSIAMHFPLGGNQCPTDYQWAACEQLCDHLLRRYGVERSEVVGHSEWGTSSCPGPHIRRLLAAYREQPPTVWFRPPRAYEVVRETMVQQSPDGTSGIAMVLPAGAIVEIGALVPGPYRAWIANGTGFVRWGDLRAHPGVTLPDLPDALITPDTALVSPPRATQQQVVDTICSRDTGGYTRYDIEQFIIPSYWQACEAVGIDPLLAVAQMCHETGNLTSWWAQRPRRNPAGIGVTGEPGAGLSFPTWARHAIPAHVGRLVAYAVPLTERTDAQQALVSIAMAARPLPPGYHGTTPTLAGLTGTWAIDPQYAERVATWANRLRGANC